MTPCERHQAQLLDHLYDLLEAGERKDLEAHLAGCEACQGALESARRQQRLIARAAKTRFEAVRFEKPPAEPATPILVLPQVRRHTWIRWAAAASVLFLLLGALKKVAVYEQFIDGAKEGFEVARNLLPYLVAMLCAIGVLRASGALEFGLDGIRWLVEAAGWDTRFVEALPTALVKPFSGSAARAMLIETMQSQGVDSFPALVAATVQGSTETTFYVLAVYFGSVGIQRVRHAVGCALLAELAGVLAAIGVCYWFFG